MSHYHDLLKKTMAEEGLAGFETMTTEKLREGIAAITAALKGPMPNHERIFQAAMRRGMQNELQRRDAPSHNSAQDNQGKE